MTGSFVHPDPVVDNDPDTVMAPPPTSLSLTVPGNGAYPNMLYSPSSDGYPQSQDQQYLPSYTNSFLDHNSANDFSAKIDPSLYPGSFSPSEPSPLSRFDKGIDSEVKTKDPLSPSQHISTSTMSPKERQAHRKAIEEKSSLKRKNAEQRLSRAITARLGGTFVPGLANQMNQAAEIIESDAIRIKALEDEINRLNKITGNADAHFKYPGTVRRV